MSIPEHKHTPGPWHHNKAGEQGIIYQDAQHDDLTGGETIAITYDLKNAPIVAAAPELLEILEESLQWFGKLAADQPDDDPTGIASSVMRHHNKAQTVINKARE